MSRSDGHASDDLLAGAATGDPLPREVSDHVAHCDSCAERLAEYTSLVEVGRTVSVEDVPSPPSATVWENITRELAIESEIGRDSSGGTVVALRTRPHRWSTAWLASGVAAGVAVGALLTAAGSALVGGETTPVAAPAPTVVAETSLAALPKKEGSGQAEIVDTPRGQALVVDVSHLSPGKGFYEVWLIDPKTFQMVGLGALTQDEGRFTIPNGLDLSRYRVVDVSLEPFDGNPVHSRDSVVRGEFQA